MPLNAKAYKVQRIARGGDCRVLDLFAGCGGFSLGFTAAGFKLVGAVEKEPTAALTHARNFSPEDAWKTHGVARDITEITPTRLVRDLGLGEPSRAVDVVLAGPPCQSYARVGRAKLREIAKNPHAFLHDRRGKLYRRLIYYVRVLKPLVVIFENVLDVLNQAGENVVEQICGSLKDLRYESRYTILNAAHYGVPQMRERVFLVAFAKELGLTPIFPPPTHRWDLPPGYKSSRDVALKPIRLASGGGNGSRIRSDYYVEPPPAAKDLPHAVTAEQALGDLPIITEEMKAKIKRGARRFDKPLSCPPPANLSAFARQMREWDGFKAGPTVVDHVIRLLPRDYPIFSLMKPGDQYPEAYNIAERLLWPQKMAEQGLTDWDQCADGPNHDRYYELRSKVVPPYDPTKFIDKWRKMDPAEPARTLTAHLSQDCYTHIHYSSEQARTISVREAARLQSFPDGFQFEGAMNAAFRQIGNAVPPLLAKALANQVRAQLLSVAGRDAAAEPQPAIRTYAEPPRVLKDEQRPDLANGELKTIAE